MEYSYDTTGTCSSRIDFEIDNGVLHNVKFVGGCNGNTKGVSALVEGMSAEDVVNKLDNIKCGFRNTSCPDQLAKAIKKVLKK